MVKACRRIEAFLVSVRPLNFHRRNPWGRTESKVQTQVVGRVETGAAADFIDPIPLGPVESHASADRVAVRDCAYQAQSQPVILIAGSVNEQHWAVAQIVDDCFKPAVIE